MKTDRYTKLILTIIALCLMVICLNGIPSEKQVQAQSGRYQIQPGGSGSVFLLETSTGKVTVYVDIGNDWTSGKGWEARPVPPNAMAR